MGFLLKKPFNLLMILVGLTILGYMFKFFFMSSDSDLPESWNMYGDIKFHMNNMGFDGLFDQYEANLFYYKCQVWKAPIGSLARKRAQQELNSVLKHRKYIHCTFREIGNAYFGDGNGLKKIMEYPLVDNWKCFGDLLKKYRILCGWSDYSLKYTTAFANICNIPGFQPSHFNEIASQVCANKCNSIKGAHLREKGPRILLL